MNEDKKSCLVLEERVSGLNPRQLRGTHKIPVTVYSKSIPVSLSLQVDHKQFLQIRNSRFVSKLSAVISTDAKQIQHTLIIKSIEKNPVTDEILNIQFHKVEADEIVKLSVPIVYTGVCPLTQMGGTLFINKKVVTISAPSAKLPSHLEFNLSKITADNNIAYYTDLEMPEGVTLKSDQTQVIVKASVPTV